MSTIIRKSDRYHISISGQLAPCDANQNACPRTTHFDTVDQAKEHFMTLINSALAAEDQPKPEATKVTSEEHARPALVFEKIPYDQPHLSFYSGVQYDYDYYGAPEGEEEVDYGRNRVYSGLRITRVDINDLLASSLGVRDNEVPADLLARATSAGYGETYAWDIGTIGGYYGEETKIIPPAGLSSLIDSWYYAHPNAKDNQGILEWVRKNGVETEGKTPVEAVKAMVKTDHGNARLNKMLDQVDAIKDVQTSQNKVLATKSRLDRAVPYNAPKKVRGRYDGVVLENAEGKFILVDGYRTLKGLKTTNPTYRPHYLVLTTPDSKSRQKQQNRFRW